LRSSPRPLITSVEHRTTVSLNGPWHAIVDPYDTGLKDYRSHVRSQDGFFLKCRRKRPQDLIEYSFDKSETLNVPGDWNTTASVIIVLEAPFGTKTRFSYHPKPARAYFCILARRIFFGRGFKRHRGLRP